MSYLSTKFNNSSIIDIGTHYGKSALALSYNKTNTIHTFNIENQIKNLSIQNRENIQFHIENLLDINVQSKWIETILQSPFIVLDIDPNNGFYELQIFEFLKRIHYNGFLICDDIWYFKEMRYNFW